MKKKIKSQIIALANELINKENSLDVVDMKQRVGKLYEKLSILEYLEKQLKDGSEDEKSKSLDSKSFREENWFTEPEQLPQSEHKDDLVEPLMEKIKDIVAQMPQESQQVDSMIQEVISKSNHSRNDLEEFASRYQQTPTFERKEPAKGVDVAEKNVSELFPKDKNTKHSPTSVDSVSIKPKSINDSIHKGLSIGLNDRLAFIKHLFDDKSEDYTRVLSQVSTMKTYEEAATFIKGRVKPDYNYWLEKDEYSERFMAIVEKSFN
ncbi:hypothetical protein [Ulvibacter antarcticus]|uniref:Uncharacterized protein n=1 Tax=Ulvibacter antarcticus TaxID=442714 RepID=A0A3L9Z6N5_9FLAO|nr:hypothetical protein [Ulvibacter antarcticus]RMA66068.1 hypothetical protein BXY75_0486 [Ulvibacter antarcticus]